MDLRTASKRGLLVWIATRLDTLESSMTSLQSSLDHLSTAVGKLVDDTNQRVSDLQAALEAERAEANRLAEDEVVEDITQEEALSEARAATDSALGELSSGADQIEKLAQQIEGLGTQEQPATEETPEDSSQTESTT